MSDPAEILRREEAGLLQAVTILPLGGRNAVRSGIQLLEKLGQRAIGVRDPDVQPDPGSRMYALPGTAAPEMEVFRCPAVIAELLAVYGLDVPAYLDANPDTDPHELPSTLASKVELLEDALSTEAVQVYVATLTSDSYAGLVAAIREAV